MSEKIKIVLLILIIPFFFVNCDFGNRFEIEFEIHTKDIDHKLSDNDPLMPTTVFVENNKPIAFEFIASPEQGEYSKRTFLKDNGEIEKIISRKNFFKNIEIPFDSIYVIEPLKNKITVYTNENDNGFEFENSKLIDEEIFDAQKEYARIVSANNIEEGSK